MWRDALDSSPALRISAARRELRYRACVARPLLPRERLSDALMQALARFGGDGTGERPAEELRLALRNMENRRCWRKESRDGSSVRPDAPKAQRLAAILGGEMPSDGTIVADRRP